ncbi:S-layer homology domain-containing protein [Bifidobacterium miconisargentati]|uniref:S-layer homology domain-containing protein n=1 Tax=Bifidobacterium miconisargentati TaxID=2834437 RepID=UPI001BDD6593|nr:S-layer homology domain-containing protein [Bifidobacterium miconisargentati]MBW3091344.1 S-layer homology domain-containing protein [Bifidobacterium miconisargentati]
MKHIGKALVAGLAALGMMMTCAITANAAGPQVGTLKLSEPTITATNIDNLKFSYEYFDKDAVLTGLEVYGITKENPIPGETRLDWPDLPKGLPTTGEFDMPDSTKTAVRKALSNSAIDGIYFVVDGYSNSHTGIPGEDGQPIWLDLTVWFDRSSQGPGSESESGLFSDVTDQTPHAADIRWLAERKIAKGFPDGTFRGMAPVNRQDMAAFLYRLAGSPDFTPDWSKSPFSDMNEKSAHAKEVLWLASTGITKGYSDGTFGGARPVVRQDMAAFLHRLADFKQASVSAGEAKSFTDVNDRTPHAADIEWLSKTGVTNGYGDGSFGGARVVVRQDMAAFLHRLSDNVLK